MPNSANKKSSLLRSIGKIFVYLKEYRLRIIIGVICSVIGVSFNIAGPYLSKMMIEVITAGISMTPVAIDYSRMVVLGSIAIAVYFVSFIATYLCVYIMSYVTAFASKKFRSDMSQKINRLPLRFFDNRQVGDVLSVVTNDVDTIGTALNQSLSTLISSVLTIIGILIMMFVCSWKIAFVGLVSIPVSLIALLFVVKKSQKHFTKQQDDLGLMNGHAEEIYSSLNVVKVFKGDKKALEKFDIINEDLRSDGRKSLFLSSMSYPITSFIGNLSFVVICIIGGIIAVKDVSQIGTIVACVTYSKQLTAPLSQIATISTSLQSAAACSERVFAFLEEEEQVDESSKVDTIENCEGNISFSHVVFGYNPDKLIIHDFNLETKAGMKVAIVGPTGAGKTTMVNLLMRFYDINSGSILIEGKSTNDLNRSYVRSKFGMVLQDTWLFEGTIKENLAFGRRDATDEEIREACIATHCDSFIRQFPGGYDMLLTEDSGLSAGQKQLLTIARAMVQNAPMLILDEATSSVDTRTELEIQEAMDNLTKGRTSFVIAHRLSTIKNSDLIIVMKDGDVIETGNHEELMNKNGFYADLYNSQFSKEMAE